jgi:hypothetical protein
LLFVKLAWAMQAAQQQGQCSPTATAAAAAATGGDSSSAVLPFLAAVGAPAASVQASAREGAGKSEWLVGLLERLARAGKQLPPNGPEHNSTAGSNSTRIISAGNSSTGDGGVSNGSRGLGQLPPQCMLLQQLADALPIPEMTLLLLEQLLLNPWSMMSSQTVTAVMMVALQHARGAAAAAEVAAVMRMPLLTQVPAAMLRAAAAVGCPGCNPQAAASSNDAARVASMLRHYSLLVFAIVWYPSAACAGESPVCCCKQLLIMQ